MLRKRSNSKTPTVEKCINIDTSNEIKNKKRSIPILPPSPKVIKDTVEIETKQEDSFVTSNVSMLRNSTALFDPDSASPSSDFINLLKLRMSIYYEPEMNILA